MIALLVLALPVGPAEAQKLAATMVGDPAPALHVAGWVKGEPIRALGQGRITVVEFWATWCGPCRESMPHLSELQARHKEKVDVVGVSVWEPEPAEIEPFVEKMGDTMAYRVAVDDVPPAPEGTANKRKWASEHGAMSTAWLASSGWLHEGIPCAFVVDGQGRVAWIGEPRELDEPLARLVAGTWDLAKESAAYRARLEIRLRAQPIRARLDEAEGKGEWTTVVQCIDELFALDAKAFSDLAGSKFQTLLVELKQPTAAFAFAREAIDGVAKDDASALGQIAYVIVFMTGEDVAPPALEIAEKAVVRANELARGKRPGILDTLARVHALELDFKAAIAAEQKAIDCARSDEQRGEFRKRLERYERLGGKWPEPKDK